MSMTIDGNSLVFDGTVTVTNFNASPTTGVCTLMLTPNGGVGSFPALAQGLPGLPPLITLGTVQTLAAGEAATVTWDQTSEGAAGTNSTYTVSFGIPQGAAGSNGETVIGSATDLSGTAKVGNIVTVSEIDSGTPKFQYTSFPWGNVYNANTFDTINTSGKTQGTLSTLSIPAQSSDYYPLVFADAIVEGTANTVVNLVATINSATTGQEVGFSRGLAGQANQVLTMIPSFGALIGASGYGKIAANTAAQIYLVAQQTANVSDGWQITDTNVSFTVVCVPVSS
ncbi:hypothetical protein MINTMi27_15170 [Mycobacterium intracellulare]|uniref:hypothetical protein n=1 Tax=Mycobacterium intracellulare TaxID=1767 RepID=UPI0019269FA8|nr:hypothetical protein [Mycobacterium intracellulare]BCP41424.1 hypothetical protein MINTMi27_15170 [Mycobacterium intracellulare]